MKNGIAVAGNLLVDDVKMIDGFPAQGMLCNIERIERCVGGCAANTAVDLARMDRSLPVRVFGAVGDDDNGRYITGVLADEGIDIRGIKIKPSIPTSFTDVMTEKTQGLRTFFHARGANAHFGLEDLDFSSIEADFFHIGYALLLDQFDAPDGDYGTVMARALKQAREHGM